MESGQVEGVETLEAEDDWEEGFTLSWSAREDGSWLMGVGVFNGLAETETGSSGVAESVPVSLAVSC